MKKYEKKQYICYGNTFAMEILSQQMIKHINKQTNYLALN